MDTLYNKMRLYFKWKQYNKCFVDNKIRQEERMVYLDDYVL